MKIQKFAARDMSEALAQVKRELGPDAMIISTRTVKRGLLATGIEVTAALDGDDSADEGPASMPGPGAMNAGPTMMHAPTAATNHYASNQAHAPTTGLTQTDVDRIVAPLRSELAALRSSVRDWSAGPSLTELRRELSATRQAMSTALANGGTVPADLESLLTTNLVAGSTSRVVALIGPTGVGKTTTIAKLAARAALVEGKKVAMVSVDNYRIGAEAQLRTYADLIGTELVQIDDLSTLAERIRRLREVGRFEQIFIDTAGRSPRDRAATQKLAQALAMVPEIETHLAIQAETAPAQIDAIIEVHRNFEVDRLLFTKLDEAGTNLEELVRTPSRAGIPVTYLTTGQLVPEDLEEATLSRLETLARNGFIDTRFQEAA